MTGQHRLPAIGHPVEHRILARRRKEAAVHALGLHAQHQHRVGGGQLGVQVVRHRHRPAGDPDRQQRRRRHQHHLGAQGGQQHDVGAGDPAVQDVADDHDAATLDVAEPLPDGQRVQQRLRRVLVGAVAGVDHRRVRRSAAAGPLREPLCRTGSRVPDDQRVGAGGAQRQRGVAQRFALAHRRSGGADVDHVGAHPLAGDLERHPGAGRVLVEHRDHRAAAQRRQLPDLATHQRLANRSASSRIAVASSRDRSPAASRCLLMARPPGR